MKPHTKEELIKRLKEIAAQEIPDERNIGAMCYSKMPPPESTCKCENCGKSINYMSWDGDGINNTVKKIAKLGFDAKVIVLCGECFKETIKELYPQFNTEDFFYDLKVDEDKTIELYPDDRNFLFYFRTNAEEPYHRVLANSPFYFELLLNFLKGKSHYLDEYDEDVFIKEHLYIIEYMTGIKE